MKKPIVVLGVVALQLIAAVGARLLCRASRAFRTSVAVKVIAQEVGTLYGKNSVVTQGDLDRRMIALHHAGMINIEVDGSGKPIDPFGTPFQIRNVQLGYRSETTVSSAGEDRRFGTTDDITYFFYEHIEPTDKGK